MPRDARIAALIRRLDEIDARQDGQPGGVGLDAHPIAEALIREGDAAVEPLLDAMEKDARLTRSVSFGRDFHKDRNLLSVRSAAFACFARITDVKEIGEGKPSVAALRTWWAKNKGASPAERWLAQLADDGEGVPALPATATYEEKERWDRERSDRTHKNKKRWMEAASNILQRADIQRRGNWVSMPGRAPGKPLPPFKGESLRGHRNPSVSALLRKRALQLSDPAPDRWGFDYQDAATLALMLYEWDPTGPDTLPTLQEVMRRCVAFHNGLRKGEGHSDQYQLGGRIARLVVARLRLGDTGAAADYESWLRTVSPQYLGSDALAGLMGLWDRVDDPAMQRIAESLFADGKGAAASEWSRLLSDPKRRGGYYAAELLASDMLRLPAFRALVLRRLRDTTAAGFVTQRGDDERTRAMTWDDGTKQGPTPPRDIPMRCQSLRLCDRAAMELQRIAGVPRFDPLASADRRDKQCSAIAAYVRRYGPTLARVERNAGPLYGHDMGLRFDYLGPVFPIRQHPATEDDVRENRAIFSLRGKTRVAADLPAPLPLEAEWPQDPDADVAQRSDGKRVPWSRGYVWQAEEVFEGGKWVRYYGYVGPHGIAKVPASQIQIVDYRVPRPQPTASGTSAANRP